MSKFVESTLDETAVGWLKEPGYEYAVGPEIAFNGFVCTLALLRDMLLPKLMSGEVRVMEE